MPFQDARRDVANSVREDLSNLDAFTQTVLVEFEMRRGLRRKRGSARVLEQNRAVRWDNFVESQTKSRQFCNWTFWFRRLQTIRRMNTPARFSYPRHVFAPGRKPADTNVSSPLPAFKIVGSFSALTQGYTVPCRVRAATYRDKY